MIQLRPGIAPASLRKPRKSAEHRKNRAAKKKNAGLHFERVFSEAAISPFDQIEWERRTAEITDDSGKVIFKQDNVEVPKSWSALATKIAVSKYFYGDIGNGTDPHKGGRETSVRQLIHRVTRTIADWGMADGYFADAEAAEIFYDELTWLCLNQHGAFNSPVWFNVGLYHQYGIGQGAGAGNYFYNRATGEAERAATQYEYPQGSACFIQSVDDTMEGIMELAMSEAMLFKYGSGTGTDLSSLRSTREKLSGGGKPSGPLSFLRVYDQIANVVKSGGKTRRAAKMNTLKDWHPDIEEFIDAKQKEEKKAWALIEQGYNGSYNGDAYGSVMYQNENLSVRVSDEFMDAALEGREWWTRRVTDGRPSERKEARALLRKIAEGTHVCGDPGMQFDSTIHKWHTCKGTGRQNSTNPCVTGDTLVATDRGWLPIFDLVGSTPIIVSGNGDLVPAARVWKTGTRPVYALKTASGLELKLTADHRVATRNRGDVPACELTVDDELILGGAKFGTGSVDPVIASLAGACLGDGCITQFENQRNIFIAGSKGESAYIEDLRQTLEAAKVLFDDGDARRTRATTVTETSTTLRLQTSVRPVAQAIEELVVIDKGSEGKQLKAAAFTLDKPSLAALLRELFTTDGTVANYGEKSQYVSLDSSSRILLGQVQLLLLQFGIRSKIYENRRPIGQTTTSMPDGRGGMKEYSVRQMHSLRISKASRIIFEREIGFNPKSAKADQLRFLNESIESYADRLGDKVVSIIPAGVEDVYDLTEPLGSHFIANGLLIHNCSEYLFLDNTACNLASLNLLKFKTADGAFDVERFKAAVRIFITAQEIVVDNASYPIREIAENSHIFRTLGLGYANLGSLIMSYGYGYDSVEGRALCGAVTAIMTGEAYEQSARLSQAMGPFPGYHEARCSGVTKPVAKNNVDSMLEVIDLHRCAVNDIADVDEFAYLKKEAVKTWKRTAELGKRHGYRNAQVTVLAPTGTISFLMDCDTTGIEPDIALVKYKLLAGGGMLKIVNQTVKPALEKLGYNSDEIDRIIAHIDAFDTIEDVECGSDAPSPRSGLKPEHLSIFDCAFKPFKGQRSLNYMAHLRMMAAAQPFLSGAISKTVNMPEAATVDDIMNTYVEGWRLGLKSIAIYRDGSKRSAPLNTRKTRDMGATDGSVVAGIGDAGSVERGQLQNRILELEEELSMLRGKVDKPIRHRMPDTRMSLTHRFEIAGHEGYITVGLYEDNQPGELFITMSKEGSTIGGLMDTVGTLTSIALQYGVPLESLVKKFAYQRFEPSGFTKNPDIRNATSITDYVFRWLACQFIKGYKEATSPNRGQAELPLKEIPEMERKAINRPVSDLARTGEKELIDVITGRLPNDGEPQMVGNGSSYVGRVQEALGNMFMDIVCSHCGSNKVIRAGACGVCTECGTSQGCS
jgi:ribonucleoside-diphosphate reductase alpha chain